MTGPALDFRNTNTLWGSVMVETLARCGVRMAVVSPGSRSTPLVVALVRHPAIETIPVLDERSAGFFALGRAKQSHEPVAVVCTSGTAAANLLPAIVEAHESGTPLVVLTADRPPEMRACASGQTIDQQKIFGSFVGFYHELGVPAAQLEQLRYLRQTIAHAVSRARFPTAGPVHLNVPFRDPLPPLPDGSAAPLEREINEDFFAHLCPAPAPSGGTIAWQRPTTTRGIIVAGPANPRDPASYAAHVQRFAADLGWPVLADALSPLRHFGTSATPIVTTYDALLRDRARAAELAPRYVLCLEGWPTSKVLRTWLEQSQAEIVLVSEFATNRDALHGRTRQLPFSVASLAASGAPAKDNSYVNAWREAEERCRQRLDTALGDCTELFEGKAAWLLARHLPDGTPLFVASSMPVRDVEYFWPVTERRHTLHFNRGANGIDGTLSSALGVAHGGAPAVLLTGDLALLHDTNGFLLRPQFRGSLTIVLINNRGGGIFEHLPIAQFDPPFEQFFATPQEANFGKLAAAYGVDHEIVRDWAHCTSLVENLPAAGIRVLELRTDRKRDAALRKRLLAGD